MAETKITAKVYTDDAVRKLQRLQKEARRFVNEVEKLQDLKITIVVEENKPSFWFRLKMWWYGLYSRNSNRGYR